MAEDNRADIFLVREALTAARMEYELDVYRDGEEMMQAIDEIEQGKVSPPDLILLDLNLPKQNGLQLLAKLRQGRVCGRVPVIVVTSSDAPKDQEAVARLGADSYFRKPLDYDEFLLLGAVVKNLIVDKGSAQ